MQQRCLRLFLVNLCFLGVFLFGCCVVTAGENLPPYTSHIEPIPTAMRQAMIGVSWHLGCPVALDDLRWVQVGYVDFAGKVQHGSLVVHKSVASDVADIFGELYAARFPIEKMQLIEVYGADDDQSMADNNTSAFNCRKVAGTRVFSQHAFGRAIDINPVQNPFIKKGVVSPSEGAAYTDRSRYVSGMVLKNGMVWKAFVHRQWKWGGSWRSVKDYQHFEKKQ
ncbi:M15 family metallopeptidase [Desulfovibrio inopinatus]|uniref:M15 family metallopeptidase n=1 Tax=Desulfovibrio inopinatus TaxID=102109 RepID=UPI0003FF259C|nr:M15 family metallopeptidase [Desulfovibrio inopinatus]